MKKGIVILALIIMALFSVSCIYAADVNDTLAASEDAGEIELSHENEMESTDNNLKTSEEQIVTQTDNEEKIGETDDGTFEALYNKISGASSGDTVYLENNYSCEDSWTREDGIYISISNLVIDGNGYTIDAKGKTRVFNVQATNVTIKNLTIKNANYEGDGGAIYYEGYCHMEITNCNFINNTASGYGGAIYFGIYDKLIKTVKNCNFTNNTASFGGAVYSDDSLYPKTFEDCNFNNNIAGYGGAIYTKYDCTMTNCNFTNNEATSKDGGAIYTKYDCTMTNCNFANNTASNGMGGVIYTHYASVKNCNFTNNTARTGGAVYSSTFCDAESCNFTNNQVSSSGGAINANYGGTLTNCSFTNNRAPNGGGAVYFLENGGATNCNFTNNTASNGEGGAIYADWVENCNFINNIASDGGAVYIYDGGKTTNCNFTNNAAYGSGGALYSHYGGTVADCDFANNAAYGSGGALYFNSKSTVTNCNFTNNTASNDGGAILFNASGTVADCDFANNTAANGGALYTYSATVKNCNFICNNAIKGSSIYFTSARTITVSNSTFLNNRANVDEDSPLQIVVSDGEIEITFTGQNNLINAIYSNGDVTFTNVTYWGADGIANTGNSTIKLSRSNREAGQNITVIMVVNDILILNATKVTDENGTIVLGAVAGNCTITARHDLDSYYTQAERTETFNITGNETVLKLNVTGHTFTAAVSPDIATGNVTFTVTNESGIVKKVQSDLTDGVAELDLTGLMGNYNITATYCGDIHYYPIVNTISISDEVPFNVSDIVISFGDVVSVVVGVPEAINGQNITITVNGTSKNATVKYGKANANFTDLPVGEHVISIDYLGDGYHSANSTTANLTVNKVDSTITVNDVTLDYGTSTSVTVTTEGATGIIAKIDGKEAVVKDNTIAIPVLDVGTYTLTVATIADGNHYNVTRNATITVNKAKTQLVAKAITTTYNADKKLVITLKDANGKALSRVKVTVKLKGTKTYTTDKNGQVKVSTKGLAPKKYTAKITFNGDKNYAKSTKDVKVTVKKAKAKIYAKKKTYRANKKTKKFKITLKDKNGKPIKKAKVRLIVKKIKKTSKSKSKKAKKKYKKNIKKTNKKGKITFKIKRNKKGKYKGTIKFYGNKYYKKAVKTVKIKMK